MKVQSKIAVLAAIALSFLTTVTVSAGPTTLFGSSIEQAAGETTQAAIARRDAAFGPLDIMRIFFSSSPGSWTTSAKLNHGRAVVVSFKDSPATILTGSRDAFYRDWFASKPDAQLAYWSFYHEPEDNIRDGEFTAQQYRDAFRRLVSLAREAGDSNLRSTLILMDYTLDPAANRNWRDYYPGADAIDVMAWDVYNFKETDADPNNNESIGVHVLRRPIVAVTAAEGKPFAIAELGYDDAGTRPAFLRDLGYWSRSNRAIFVTYFDSVGALGDHRLTDESSQNAWDEVVDGRLFYGTPILSTIPASSVGGGAATFTCDVDPLEQATEVTFASWRNTTGNNDFIETAPVTINGGPERLTTTRSGLIPGARYTYRCKAYRNGSLVSRSNTQVFTAQ